MIDRSRLSPRTLERLEDREAIMMRIGGLSAPQAAKAALQDALRHVLSELHRLSLEEREIERELRTMNPMAWEKIFGKD